VTRRVDGFSFANVRKGKIGFVCVRPCESVANLNIFSNQLNLLFVPDGLNVPNSSREIHAQHERLAQLNSVRQPPHGGIQPGAANFTGTIPNAVRNSTNPINNSQFPKAEQLCCVS